MRPAPRFPRLPREPLLPLVRPVPARSAEVHLTVLVSWEAEDPATDGREPMAVEADASPSAGCAVFWEAPGGARPHRLQNASSTTPEQPGRSHGCPATTAGRWSETPAVEGTGVAPCRELDAIVWPQTLQYPSTPISPAHPGRSHDDISSLPRARCEWRVGRQRRARPPGTDRTGPCTKAPWRHSRVARGRDPRPGPLPEPWLGRRRDGRAIRRVWQRRERPRPEARSPARIGAWRDRGPRGPGGRHPRGSCPPARAGARDRAATRRGPRRPGRSPSTRLRTS